MGGCWLRRVLGAGALGGMDIRMTSPYLERLLRTERQARIDRLVRQLCEACPNTAKNAAAGKYLDQYFIWDQVVRRFKMPEYYP